MQPEIINTESRTNKLTMSNDRFIIKFGKNENTEMEKRLIVNFCNVLYNKHKSLNNLNSTLRSKIRVKYNKIMICLQTNDKTNRKSFSEMFEYDENGLEIVEPPGLTLKVIESFKLQKEKWQPDYNDLGFIFTLPNGIELSTLTVCNGEVCESSSLEGWDGWICIDTKQELIRYMKMGYLEIIEHLINKYEDFDPKPFYDFYGLD